MSPTQARYLKAFEYELRNAATVLQATEADVHLLLRSMGEVVEESRHTDAELDAVVPHHLKRMAYDVLSMLQVRRGARVA